MSEGDASPEVISVKFLADEPSEKDFFGSHGRVARAVSDVIREANSVNIIGLLGSWGSGKSTVVKQMSQHLAEVSSQEEMHFFTYDAWLHQNDPPRRAFLESLIGDLTSNALATEKDWSHRLSDLSGKSEETVTQTTRSLSTTGKWIVGSFGLVPLGLAFLDFDLVEKAFGTTFTWAAFAVFCLSLLLTIAPVVVATGFYLAWRPWRNVGVKGPVNWSFWTKHKTAYEDQSIFALLTNQSVERSENKTKISPEPSAIEFRAVFRDVLIALKEHKERLIIVIDNLDRLAENDAMQLWATIRSLFIGDAITENGVALAPPTIILPIDEGAIERMFALSHPDQAKVLAGSFMDKTFDITFHVNDPVMSDWRNYLTEKLKIAFADAATPDRIYWSTKIIEERLVRDGPSRKVTPRRLIKLINHIGALVKQWGDGSIDFLSMVFFALHRAEISENVTEFVKGEWASMDSAVLDWKRDIVALHFGVSPNKAYQALLREPLKLAILSNDKIEFETLLTIDGFAPVFESVIADPPAGSGNPGPSSSFVGNATLLISDSSQKDEIWARRSTTQLVTAWCDSGGLDSFRLDFAEIINALAPFAAASKDRFVAASSQMLGISLPKSSLRDETIQSFSRALVALNQFAQNNGIGTPAVTVSLEPSSLFQLLPELTANLAPMIKSEKTSGEIMSGLVTDLGTEALAAKVPAAVRALTAPAIIQFKDKAKLDWGSLANAAFTVIQGNAIGFFGTGPAVDIIGLLHSKHADSKSLLVQLFDQGLLAARLNEADLAKDVNHLADITALMFVKGTDFAGPNGKAWDVVIAEHPTFIENVRKALFWYLWGNPTTYAHKASKTRPSLKPIIDKLLQLDIESQNPNGISAAYLFANIELLKKDAGQELFNKCLRDISSRDDFWTSLSSLEMGRTYDNAVETIAQLEEIDRSKLIEAVREKLKSASTEDWNQAIFEDVAPANLSRFYHVELGQSDELGDELKVALTEAAPSLLENVEAVLIRWFLFTKFITRNARATLFKNLRDAILAGNATNNISALVSVGGESFLSDGKFDEAPDKVTRHIVMPLIASEEGREVLRIQTDFFARMIKSSEGDTKASILEMLDTVKAGFDKSEYEEFDNYTSSLGLGKIAAKQNGK
jgi:energy-coupling factor transporter ATP-binding protein EcfA2